MASESFEFLTPGTTQAIIDGVKDYVSTHAAQPEVTSGTEDEAAWLQRETAAGFPVGGRATVRSIKGKTVVWNQLVQPVAKTVVVGITEVTLKVETDGKVSYTGETVKTGGRTSGISPAFDVHAGHKYIIRDTMVYDDDSTTWFLSSGSDVVARMQPNAIVTVSTSATVIVGKNLTTQGKNYNLSGYVSLFDLTLIFGAGNEPSTVAEFEQMYPASYYPYSAPTLQSAHPTGIESEDADGNALGGISIPIDQLAPNGLRSAGSVCDELTADALVTRIGAVDLGTLTWQVGGTNVSDVYRMRSVNVFTAAMPPATARAMPDIDCAKYPTNTASLQWATPTLSVAIDTNGYVWVYDPDYNTASSVEAFTAAMSGVMLQYALATPTTTPIDPPLNFTYRCEAGGTETVTHTEATSAPTLEVVYEIDGTAAAASIAPLEGRIASTNYSLGALLMLGGTLVKVTTAIATGEQIILGQNVEATTVAAELAALA